MPLRLHQAEPGFEAAFLGLLEQKREISEDVDQTVRAIIADVRARGDQAVLDATNRFDRRTVARFSDLAIDISQLGPDPTISSETHAALELAAERIRSHHERQKPVDVSYRDALGVELGWRFSAIDAVGLYVPGGTAAYPSSVLMNAIPAKVSGVSRIVMVVPAPDGRLSPLVLAAAHIAGVDEIWTIGGAQAVAALAYGTESLRPVSKIVGPGNAYVAAAKRQVFGQVGIDMIAGPSEFIAADLLAQAEHDTAAQSILMTDDQGLADAVVVEVEAQLSSLPRQGIARASWRDFGAIITLNRMEDAVALANRIAAEHVELMGASAEALSPLIRNAGAIFLGEMTPEAIGDYVGGSNHVLPTARSARYASGLGVADFVKRTSLLRVSPQGLSTLGPAAIALGEAEGLDGHARSVAMRLNARRS
jgi:histidinol dehydrogenase